MSLSLYSDNNPETTIHGYGYKDAKKARETIKLVEASKRDDRYKFNVINTMYYRAKHHKYRTKEMEKAMSIFEKWLNKHRKKEKSRKKKESIKKFQKGGSKEFPYLPLSLVNDYEKMAEYYNISRKARGLEKPTTSDKGFLVVFREVKGNADKLKSIPVRKDKENGVNWYEKRDNQVKAKYSQMKKMGIKLFHEDGPLKNLPTKMHVNMIMWAFSPEIKKLKKNKSYLNNI